MDATPPIKRNTQAYIQLQRLQTVRRKQIRHQEDRDGSKANTMQSTNQARCPVSPPHQYHPKCPEHHPRLQPTATHSGRVKTGDLDLDDKCWSCMLHRAVGIEGSLRPRIRPRLCLLGPWSLPKVVFVMCVLKVFNVLTIHAISHHLAL